MKKIYFDLEIRGKRITNIEELKENFHLQQVTDYFNNKVLDIWLENKDSDILAEIRELRNKEENDIKLKSIDLSKKEKYTGLIKAFNMEESDYKIIIDGLVDSDNIPIEAKTHSEKNKDLAKVVFNDNKSSYENSKNKIPLEIENNLQMSYLEQIKNRISGTAKITFLDINSLEVIEENIKFLDNAYSFLKEIDIDNFFKRDILELYKKVQTIILIKMLSKQSLRETIMSETEIKTIIESSLNLIDSNQKKFIEYYEEHFNKKSDTEEYLILRDEKGDVTLSIVGKDKIEKADKNLIYIPLERR